MTAADEHGRVMPVLAGGGSSLGGGSEPEAEAADAANGHSGTSFAVYAYADAVEQVLHFERVGGDVIEGAAIVDLPELGGSARLRESGLELFTLVDFEGH